MIPKKIHYVWLGQNPIPDNLQQCISSWKIHMPDYEIIRWDESKISEIDNIFMQEAIEQKKWAFASDYIRVYALYHEGGLYFDTDLIVYKSFDDLLGNRAFIGAENSRHISKFRTPRCLTSFCMGAEPQHPFVKAALDYYSDRHFVRSKIDWLPEDLKFEVTVNTYVLMEIARTLGYNPLSNVFPQHLAQGLTVYPPRYFNPLKVNNESYAFHMAEGSWREEGIGRYGSSLFFKFKKQLRIWFLKAADKAGIIIIKQR